MFGGVNVWRIAELKVIGEIKFGEWIDFGHKDTIYQLKFGWLKFGESRTTRQIRQTFPPPNIPAIRYIVKDCAKRSSQQQNYIQVTHNCISRFGCNFKYLGYS